MKHFPTTTALLVALASLVAIPALSAPAGNADLPNFGQVAPGLYRGAAPTDAGLAKLKAMGVRTIIDLRIAPHKVKTERKEAEKLGLRFVNLPMGGSMPPTKTEVATFLQLADNAGKQPVYVHCQHGADRTGTMVGIYRETHDHWSFTKAYAEMRHYGFNPRWIELTQSVEERAPK